MKTEARDLAIVIEFEEKDWQNGLARYMISGMKRMPYGMRKYHNEDKTWHILPTAKARNTLLELYSDWEKSLPYHWTESEEYDIQDFLEQFN